MKIGQESVLNILYKAAVIKAHKDDQRPLQKRFIRRRKEEEGLNYKKIESHGQEAAMVVRRRIPPSHTFLYAHQQEC